ncbi:MAG: hypothetical protein ABFC57_01720 [Veillonellales bacterium]
MDDKPKGTFENDMGNKSYIRVMGAWSFVFAVIVAGIILLRGGLFIPATTTTTEAASTYIFTAFFVGGFAPQVIQKFAEIFIPLIIAKFKQG